MRVAGVRLDDGRMVWVRAGDLELAPADRVSVKIGDGEETGMVFVTPEQFIPPGPEAAGTVVGFIPNASDAGACFDVPGADLPPLGSEMNAGTVVQVDPVARTVTVEREDGSRIEL